MDGRAGTVGTGRGGERDGFRSPRSPFSGCDRTYAAAAAAVARSSLIGHFFPVPFSNRHFLPYSKRENARKCEWPENSRRMLVFYSAESREKRKKKTKPKTMITP